MPFATTRSEMKKNELVKYPFVIFGGDTVNVVVSKYGD
jgi:hypothetical protein